MVTRKPEADISTRALTVRLTAEQAEELEAVALVDNIPVAEAIRLAVAAHIEARRHDEAFQERRKESLARSVRLLERLAGS